MEREREDSSQESGVEKVNNGRIDEIAMGDQLQSEEYGRTLIYNITVYQNF